jgi:hypothetical protein
MQEVDGSGHLQFLGTILFGLPTHFLTSRQRPQCARLVAAEGCRPSRRYIDVGSQRRLSERPYNSIGKLVGKVGLPKKLERSMSLAGFKQSTRAFTKLLRTIAMAFVATVSSLALSAQVPVPTGEAAQSVQLNGSVEDSTGAVVAGVRVTVAGENRTVTVFTDSTGHFSASVPSGHYAVTATASGFAEERRNVTVLPSQSATVTFILGGPVPVGEAVPRGEPAPGNRDHTSDTTSQREVPGEAAGGNNGGAPRQIPTPLSGHGHYNVPSPDSGARTVSGQFEDWTELTNWLNAQAVHGLRLQSIFAMDKYKNLFVWAFYPGKDQYIVVAANTVVIDHPKTYKSEQLPV